MIELMATDRKARSRYFTCEQLANGSGVLILGAADFTRTNRDRLTAEIVIAYEGGQLVGEALDLARRIGTALQTTLPTLEALRVHLRADGREMVAQIRKAAAAVPALRSLIEWIAL